MVKKKIKEGKITTIKLLEETMLIITKKGYSIGNLDTVIIADKPKLLNYKDKMRDNIAEILKIDKDKISIKATTEEGTRNTETIAAYAVALLK